MSAPNVREFITFTRIFGPLRRYGRSQMVVVSLRLHPQLALFPRLNPNQARLAPLRYEKEQQLTDVSTPSLLRLDVKDESLFLMW